MCLPIPLLDYEIQEGGPGLWLLHFCIPAALQGDIPSQDGILNRIMRTTPSIYEGGNQLSCQWHHNCCLDVQIFAKMTVPRCIYPHGLNLAVIYISQPRIHLSYVLH